MVSRRSKSAFFGVGALLLVAALAASNDARDARVDALFEKWERTDSPGCALGVIEDGQLVYKRGYGMANLEHDIRISETSVFRMASLSKQFAAFAILLAEQQGKLSLDDDIRKYLPELPERENIITIRHLIHHTSGMRDYLTLMDLRGHRPEDFFAEEDVVEALAVQERSNFEPGEEYLYSNSGYFLLSEIIPRATGSSLQAFSETYIFEPLKMHDTHFHDDFRHIVQNRAAGYRPLEEGGYEIHMTTLNMVGDGGIYTTIEDLLLWDRNFYTGEVGSEEIRKKRVVTGKLNDGTEQDYAFGLAVSHYRGLATVSHGGSWVGFRTAMLQFPEQRFSTYVLCNVSAAAPTRLARRIADIYLEDAFTVAADAKLESPVVLSESELRAFAGVYWNEETGGLAELAVEDSALVWKEAERKLTPVGEGRFAISDEGVRTEVDIAGTTMTVRSPGQRVFHYERVLSVVPSLAELSRHVGIYRCRELEVTYHIELDDESRLVMVSPSRRSGLEPVFEDGFRWEWGSVLFTRDNNGAVSGFELASGRARNFIFARAFGLPPPISRR